MRILWWRKKEEPQEATISAVVIRADGTREDLGVISRGKVEFTPAGQGKKRKGR